MIRVRRYLIPHAGSLLTTADIARMTGITQGQAMERVRKGLSGPALFAPKADHREAARRNPDPFGWSWRRANGK